MLYFILLIIFGLLPAVFGQEAILACMQRVSNSEASCYLNRYPDLKAAFGDDLNKAKRHWCQFGSQAEKRDKTCHGMLRASTQTVTKSHGQAPTDQWVTREAVMDRAYVWVDARVPYSQKLKTDGYRQDCSGFISYAWGTSSSSGGLTTRNIADVCTRIYDKKDMKAGDIFLGPTHVVLFGGWKDKYMDKYVQLAETQTGDVCRESEGSWKWRMANGYVPYRYNFIL